MTALETSYLVPGPGFLLGVLVLLLGTVALVLVPLVQAWRQAQWGWVLGIVLLGPIGGLAWYTRRRTPAPRTT